MSEKKLYEEKNVVSVQASDMPSQVKDLKNSGYRLVQVCATKTEGGFQVMYSFDKEHELFNYKVDLAEEETLQSITGEYWPAFIYENEMKDLFGIKIKNIALDYEGHFFKVAQPTPWNPKE